ncbi:MAG: acyl carrier protein [Polyangiaceae bacterium]|nr:acyl carrier protein [Polyangiaceae bacterium]
MIMGNDEARDTTLSVLAKIAEVDRAQIRGGDRLREDLGMDSLSSLELLSSLEEKLHVEFEIEEAMNVRTVDDVCAFVLRHCKPS